MLLASDFSTAHHLSQISLVYLNKEINDKVHRIKRLLDEKSFVYFLFAPKKEHASTVNGPHACKFHLY
jgi:hypothetical protein